MSLECARSVMLAEINAIQAVMDRLDDRFLQALDCILSQPARRVITCGIGKAGIIAQKVAATLASTGTTALFLHPADALHGDLGMVGPDDAMLVFSNSGESDEISRLLPYLRRDGNPVIAITASTRSTLGVQADVVLEMGTLDEACPLGLAPTASTTAMLAIGDALAIALMRRRGFTMHEYARFHPGGALGQKSFQVRNAMRAAGAVAFLTADMPVRDAIAAISAARAGAGVVVDDAQQLLGVFTDGDLRRMLLKDGCDLAQPVRHIMTAHPRSVGADESVADALALMREHRIAEVPVVEADGTVVGMADLKSLLAEFSEEAT